MIRTAHQFRPFITLSFALLLGAQAMPALAACWDVSRPNARYVVNTVDPNNGFVVDTDASSKLMWARCATGLSGASCSVATSSGLSWTAALSGATASTLAQYNDWRLPTQDELLSIATTACSNPAINATVFPATPGNAFWSSTEDVNAASNAYVVNFFNAVAFVDTKVNPGFVRWVRGGLPLDPAVTTAQTLSFGAPPTLTLGTPVSVVVTGSSPNSGNPIRYTSNTPATCSVDGNGLVTPVGAGICTIAANRYGRVNAGANYAPTTQVTQSMSVNCWDSGTVPKPASLYVQRTAANGVDVTLIDSLTNLMWKQCHEGLSGSDCATGSAASLNFFDAQTAATNSGFAGYNNWRVPTLNELQSLLPSACVFPGPTINTSAFPNTPLAVVWTSYILGGSSGAWTVSFVDGLAQYNGSNAPNKVRLVRTAQPFEMLPLAPQTLTFTAAPTLTVGGSAVVSATSAAPNSGNPVRYASTTSSVCVVNIASGVVSLIAGATAGSTCSITGNQLGGYSNGKNYTAAVQTTQSLVVSKIAQSLVFGASPAITVGGTGLVSATSNQSLTPVSFTSTTTPVCSVSGANGSSITGITAGTCTITASQSGDATTYLAATANQSFSIGAVPISCTLHMDGANAIVAVKEGLILLRAMLGLKGTAVTAGTGISTPWDTLRDQLNAHCGTHFQ